jgi:ribosomal protein S18 acetylase RimI-like enzyme
MADAGPEDGLSGAALPDHLEDTITYLEMHGRPTHAHAPTPGLRLALLRAEECTVSFYRYLYAAVGEPWLWFERRLLDDAALAAIIRRPTTEIEVLYVKGVPAGYFELERSNPEEVELAYFGLVPEFIGRGLGRWFLEAAVEAGWRGPTKRLWVHTSTFDHPRALGLYQRVGFRVYDRRKARFPDPRTSGILPAGAGRGLEAPPP